MRAAFLGESYRGRVKRPAPPKLAVSPVPAVLLLLGTVCFMRRFLIAFPVVLLLAASLSSCSSSVSFSGSSSSSPAASPTASPVSVSMEEFLSVYESLSSQLLSNLSSSPVLATSPGVEYYLSPDASRAVLTSAALSDPELTVCKPPVELSSQCWVTSDGENYTPKKLPAPGDTSELMLSDLLSSLVSDSALLASSLTGASFTVSQESSGATLVMSGVLEGTETTVTSVFRPSTLKVSSFERAGSNSASSLRQLVEEVPLRVIDFPAASTSPSPSPSSSKG